MTKQVLIIDQDSGFSTILKETLNAHPAFNAKTVKSGSRALHLLSQNNLDLAIVDMALSDMSAEDLIAAIKIRSPKVSTMVIPLMGQELPPQIQAMNIQGVLTKPFYVGNLPKLVGEALGLEIEAEEPDAPPEIPEEAPAPKRHRLAPRTKPKPAPTRPSRPKMERSSRPNPSRSRSRPTNSSNNNIAVSVLPSWKLEQLRKQKNKLIDELVALNGEIHAEVILLTVGTELVAKAGNMPDERAQTLASLVAQSAETAAQAAAFLGERDARFEQSLHEGSEYRLYSYSLGQGVVLSLALGTQLPLGILRHQTRLTSKALLKYIK